MPSNRQNHNPQAIRQKPVPKTDLGLGSGAVKDSSMSGGGTGKVVDSATGASKAFADGKLGQVSKTKTGTSGK